MKTCIKLISNNIASISDRKRFLRFLNIMGRKNRYLIQVKGVAKDVDEISWSKITKQVRFRYEENREYEESEATLTVNRSAIDILEAFLVSEVIK